MSQPLLSIHDWMRASSCDSVRLVFSARTNYMYARVRSTLPELHAFTLCTWLRRTGLGLGTILSYAVTGQPNELTLMEAGGDGVEVVVNDKVMLLPLRVPRLTWHHVCVTWSARDGAWSSFLDGVRTGSGDGLAPWRPLTGGGVIVLGQEQDVLGGHFDATQAFVGELTQLGVWAVALPPQAVSSLAFCVPADTPARVLAWSRRGLEVRGGRGILREGPPCPLEQ
ncbi:neuronal pentraxin-2-like [Petromyzon marinus]|uniref:neuronal pentraxin-2-like n=1 Tax=Petromyzon marinus TaxID=7757 RepID=UPI003F707792